MEELRFWVPGKPQAKERPVFGKDKNGRRVVYTPARTTGFEEAVQWCFLERARKQPSFTGDPVFNGPVEVSIRAVFSVAKSDSKKKKEMKLSGEIPCTQKPDCDNIAKAVLDGLNKVAYGDDRQVVKLSVSKEYGDETGVEISIRETA